MRLSVAASLLFLSFHVQSNGVNAEGGLCNKERNNDYKCGSSRGAAPYWPVTTTCTQNQCCCHDVKGWEGGTTSYQRATCDEQDNSVIGCFACSGIEALEISMILMSVIQVVMGIIHVKTSNVLLLVLAVAIMAIIIGSL